MASTSLYRRHRPQSFAEVVGQEAIVRTLGNAIESEKVHHAYLFVGSRGTGKTSIAKILARSINCEQGPTLSPCGVCESCTSIAAGTSMDVIEMDAASNNSVDDIRELRERVGISPTKGHRKVYILDEVHMLSTAAWNAFLKTLEEPPPHAIFVLATTDSHKVLPTIVDRCQRFDFRRPSLEQLLTVLRRVCESEGIEADDRALAMIARSAEGSFRDALGTLDQLVTYGGSKLSTDDVIELLDVSDSGLIFAATDAIAAHDPRGALERVSELADSGRDPAQFMVDLTEHLRRIVVAQTLGEAPDAFSLTADQAERLVEQAGALSQVDALKAIDLIAAAHAATKEGSDARIQLELALLKASNPRVDASMEALFARLEKLEQGGGAASPRSQPKGPPPVDSATSSSGAPSAASAVSSPREVAQTEAATPDAEVEREPQGSNGHATAAVADDVSVIWPAVIERVREAEGGEMLAALLSDARPAAIEDDVLVLNYPHSASFSKRKVENPANGERITEMLKLVAGRPLRIRVELTEDEQPTLDQQAEVDEEEIIRRVKDAFNAEEVTVASKQGGSDEATDD
jgi:DNA polymerase-3 subunit gamma/tau